jgi:hypothetical protein
MARCSIADDAAFFQRDYPIRLPRQCQLVSDENDGGILCSQFNDPIEQLREPLPVKPDRGLVQHYN